MNDSIMERIDRLNRKYSQYGEVHDYSLEGSTEEVQIPWNVAKTIALERDGYKCRICGRAPMISENIDGVERLRVEVEVHHIVPRIVGGSDSTKNLITLCKDCHIKTFKNSYKGVPKLERGLDEMVEVLTNSRLLLKYGTNCQSYSLTSFQYRNGTVILKEPIECKICNFPSLKRINDIVFGNDLDVEEIVIKDKNRRFCLGIIEK